VGLTMSDNANIKGQILADLNDEQNQAVNAPLRSALILAGAGSGKTRVLTHRIAWLCAVEGISEREVMAVTFTNKAANEMRSRIQSLSDKPIAGMWVGTFHSLCHRLLRYHHEQARLSKTFQVIDAIDQLRLIKRITRDLNISEDRCPFKKTQYIINAYKEAGQRADRVVEDTNNPTFKQILAIYHRYEALCRETQTVDFAELLLATHEMLRDNDDLRRQYQARFKQILVDEFQDTNKLQYAWLRVLASDKIPVFAVGDDDQSIYGWRGACVENIQNFERDFKDVCVYRLERNYRSTAIILDAANALIENNKGRMGKRLWTKAKGGDKIKIFAALNENEETDYVVEVIHKWQKQRRALSELAVCYRANAQSRVIENALVSANIPYRVYGGLRFFDRAIIKHALAYLRLIANHDDDTAFERIVNYPPRGIGARTMEMIRDQAKANVISLWQSAEQLMNDKALGARANSVVQRFLQLIENFSLALKVQPLAKQAEQVVALLTNYLREQRNERALSDIENLEELIRAAEQFSEQWKKIDEDEIDELDAFLSHTALDAGDNEAEYDEDSVQLMTLHSAKGLEFPLVIITGMEEGLFPHSRSLEDLDGLEEERRLCYVGITRAREQLILCYAQSRNMHGNIIYNRPSRFINELPTDLVDEIRPQQKHNRLSGNAFYVVGQSKPSPDPNSFSSGQRVNHPTFGDGVVLDFEGEGSHARTKVRFDKVGTKWLVLAYTRLQKI